ncbi:hypothetical protein [Pseudosporangium ferrugineum]|uniref:Methyltransferase family protein n=1 Tax=Pseudosporangium ferrugineum TaxID=439699 RepID=A0A2T0SHX2_9ACTN|nr:hypothetical protein [Pseudosporangium ferrugineum]PRY33010.1 hypothetical protein CLV70_101171 [Pseudosporangium ferrugineum]
MNPRFLGGEMLVWSDLDGAHGPGPVRGAALVPFLAAARGRTLVAGPHDPALLAALPGATVLVRGVPDAERLAAAGNLTVLCGGPAKLAAEPAFDTIIALDGLGRLGTAEQDEATWLATLDSLRAALAPGGLLMLGLANPLGLHRLVAVPRPPADSDWTPGYDDTRPATPAALAGLLGGTARVYAAYPDPVAPRLVLPSDAGGGAAEAALARAYAGADAGETLTDPEPWARESLRRGQPLAPGWIVVAAPRPPAIEVEVPGPSGRTVESLVAGAAARRDLPAVRALLSAWQESPAAGVPAGQVISGPDGVLTPLVPTADPDHALHDLAERLLRAGDHPWPGVTGPADLAALLAAMTGREAGVAEVRQPRPLPFAELRAERDRLTREVAEVRAQAAFLEAELTAREADLRRARRTVELLSGKGPARAGQVFVGGVRAARRLLRHRP